MRAGTCAVVTSLLASAACGPPQETVTSPLVAPEIEVAKEQREKLLGAGDGEADRCFDAGAEDDSAACTQAASPEACAGSCRTGDLGACRRFADWHAQKGDHACASKIHELACGRGGLASCMGLAEELTRGKSAHNYPRRWRQLLDEACKGGHGPACRRLGYHDLEGFGGNAHPPREGLERLGKACELEDADGCRLAADAYSPTVHGPFSNAALALTMRQRACDLGDHTSCVELGRALAFGMGTPKDPARARQLLQRVCNLDQAGGEACRVLGQLVEQDKGLRHPDALALYRRGCNKGDHDSCVVEAPRLYDEQRYEDAIALATKALAKGDNWRLRSARGLSRFDLARYGEAADDLERLCALRSDWMHCELYLFAARERAGRKGARSGLEAATKRFDLSKWPGPVLEHYLGRTSEASVIRKAKEGGRSKQKEQLCEAYYYLGQLELIRGHRQRAAELFEKSIATGITNFIEHASSQAELKRLKQAAP